MTSILCHSVVLILSFLLQGIRQIKIGTKLQEVGSWHQYKGCTFLDYAMAGADMSYLWDMCSELFGEIEEDKLVPSQFDSPPAKKLHTEAEKEEAKVGEAYQPPMPYGTGVPSDFLPLWESVKREGGKGGHKSISIYTCLFCDHKSENRTSTVTHTHHHNNVVVASVLLLFLHQ